MHLKFDIAQKLHEFLLMLVIHYLIIFLLVVANPWIIVKFPIISIFKLPEIQEIRGIVDELKISSAGHDNISVFLVKQVKCLILQPLSHIFFSLF